MKKMKGFTLVELLAVIIIISLLSLLAGISVTKLVKDSKEDLYNTQIKLLKSASKSWGAENMNRLPDKGECGYLTLKDLKEAGFIDSNIIDSKTKQELSDELKVKISTTENDYGKLITNYEVNPENIDGCYNLRKYKNGEIVYYDVKNGVSCNNYYEDNSKTGYNGITSTTGNQNNCLKFYAFNDNGKNTLNLLLDHNTTATVEWYPGSFVKDGPSKEDGYVLNILKLDTEGWSEKIVAPSNYVYEHSLNPYTVDYSGYKARLIEAQEIAQITGADKALNWNEFEVNTLEDWFYLDGVKGTDEEWHTQIANSTNKSEYYWLFDRTEECVEYGCIIEDSSNEGYWTSTANDGGNSEDCDYAIGVDNKGRLSDESPDSNSYGVRPVIEVSKITLN